MKKTISILMAAGAVAVVTPAFAQDANTNHVAVATNRINNAELTEKLRKMTPAEAAEYVKNHPEVRRQSLGENTFLKSIGLEQKDLKGLTPAEVRAKVSDASDKKLAELEKKSAEGSLSEQDKRLMRQLQARKRFNHPPSIQKPGETKAQPAAEVKKDEPKKDVTK